MPTTPQPDTLSTLLLIWPVLLTIGAIIATLAVALYRITQNAIQIEKVKRGLYHEDGALHYVTKREFDKVMETTNRENDNNLTTKAHDQICETRLLKFEKSIGGMFDMKLADFEKRLLKELRLNGYAKQAEA